MLPYSASMVPDHVARIPDGRSVKAVLPGELALLGSRTRPVRRFSVSMEIWKDIRKRVVERNYCSQA